MSIIHRQVPTRTRSGSLRVMKFRITKEQFLDALQQVQHVVSSRNTLPILSNVLIEASESGLRLTTTDLDVGVSGQTEAEVLEPGQTTLPVRRLASIIRELPATEIEVSVDAAHVASIRSGPSFFKIIGLAASEFPPLADFKGAKRYEMPQEMVQDGLKKTSYAISNDETRYVLNGIFTSFKEGKLTLVATDGRRLAMVENELNFPADQEVEFIVPTKAVQELQRMLTGEGTLVLLINDNQIRFEIGKSLIVSKLIEGNYPNYRQVIPGEAKQRLSMGREKLLETVRRVALLSSDKSNSVKLSFSDNELGVTANSPDIGEAQETVEVKYSGEQFSIAFNPDFLQAPLKALGDEEVHLDLIDEMSPGVLRTDDSFLYVLMPMRVTG